MTRTEFKIEAMMQECKVGRKTAIAYLDAAKWILHHAVSDFNVDKVAVKQGILNWKHPITE